MKASFVATEIIALLSCLGMLLAQINLPRITTVNPMTAEVGDVITAAGENLDKNNVAARKPRWSRPPRPIRPRSARYSRRTTKGSSPTPTAAP